MAKSRQVIVQIEKLAKEKMVESGVTGTIEKDFRGTYPSITIRLRPGDGVQVREFMSNKVVK